MRNQQARSQVEMAADFTAAESAFKIAVEKCEALGSTARVDCLARADDSLAEARARAREKLERTQR